MDRQYPGSKLPDPQEALSKQVPSSAIFAVNSEVAVLQPSAGAKVRGAYRIAGNFRQGKFSPISPVSSSGENLIGENFVG